MTGLSQYLKLRIYTDAIFLVVEGYGLTHVSKLKLPINVEAELPEAVSRLGVLRPSPVDIELWHSIVLQMVLASSIVVQKLPPFNKKRRTSHDRGEKLWLYLSKM
jgi:hypothetical protein